MRRAPGWVSEPAEAGGADPPRADVLVAVGARAELRARVVEVDQPQPVEADPRRRTSSTTASTPAGRVDRVAGAPQVRGVEAEPEPARGRRPRRRSAASIARQLLDRRPEPGPDAGAVLEHDEDDVRRLAVAHRRSRHAARAPSARRAIPASAPAPRCEPDVDVDERRAPRRRDAQLVREDRRPIARGAPGPARARLTRYGAWTASGPMSRPARRSRKAGSSSGQRRPAAPRGRVVGEHLDRGRADLGRAVGGPDQPLPERQVGADPPAVGEHRREAYRSGTGRHLDWRRGRRPARGPAGARRHQPAPDRGAGRRHGRRPSRTSRWSCASRVPSVARQLEVLVAAGLVERTGDGYDNLRARFDRVGELARDLARSRGRRPRARRARRRLAPRRRAARRRPSSAWARRPTTSEDPAGVPRRRPADDDPGPAPKRQVVLRFLLERVFTEDRDYPEKEVNQRLALFHPDVAALRRYLSTTGYVDRDAAYRRARSRPSPSPGRTRARVDRLPDFAPRPALRPASPSRV